MTVTRATVKGNVLVAVAQGALGGLMFWLLGIQAALLWAVLMAFAALLPAVGAALVWGPVAVYLLASEPVWQGAALIAYGVLVIGLVDNLLRPMLVGKDTKLPDYVVLVSTLGGLALFGASGLVIGPAIAALFMAAWNIFTQTPLDADAAPMLGRALGEQPAVMERRPHLEDDGDNLIGRSSSPFRCVTLRFALTMAARWPPQQISTCCESGR